MRRSIVVVLALGALAVGARAGGQQPAPTTPAQAAPTAGGVILGTVIDETTGKSISGAVVSLGGRGAPQSPVVVGRDGRFVFRDLAQASYALLATRAGYFGGGAGQRTPTGPRRPVELGDGERVGDVTLRLWRYGVIGGRVSDDTGEPAVALRVDLLERLLDNGQWRLQQRQTSRTDDRGQYRFGKVTPGHYVVSVRQDPDSFMESVMTAMAADISALTGLLTKLMMAGGPPDAQIDFRARVFPMTFAPSAAIAADAAPVVIGPGDDRSQIDVRVASVATYRVAGTIAGPEATPPNLTIQLTSPSLMDQPVGINLTEGRGGGRFDIAGVPPGQYTLRAIAVPRQAAPGGVRGGGPGQFSPTAGRVGGASQTYQLAPADPTWWAGQPITIVDRDEVGVSLLLRQGSRIRGRLVFDGAAAPAPLERMAIFASAVDNPGGSRTNGPAGVAPDGTFHTVGLAPGRYLIRLSATFAPWRLRSVRVAGRDLTELPIEVEADDVTDVVVTLTDRSPASLTGKVRNARGDDDPDAVVLIFPADRQLWDNLGTSLRTRSSRVSATGVYSIPNLPDGDYFVFAGGENLLADWLQPKVLGTLSGRATRVTVAEAERKSQDLTRRDR